MRQALLLSRGFAITPELISKSLLQTGLHRPAADQTLEVYIGEVLEKAKRGELQDVQGAMMEIVKRELYRQALRLDVKRLLSPGSGTWSCPECKTAVNPLQA